MDEVHKTKNHIYVDFGSIKIKSVALSQTIEPLVIRSYESFEILN